MGIIDRYISRSFLVAFVVTLAIFTFVMSIGVVFRVTDLLARGASWRIIVYIFAAGIPSALSFAAPVSALASSLLVFGRMSADSEIVAMKACGIGMWQVVARPVFLAIVLSMICVYVNFELAPFSRYVQRVAIKALGFESAVNLLEEGRFIRDFPGMTVYVGRRSADHVFDIIIYQSEPGQPRREIRAKWGIMAVSADKKEMNIDLRDVRVDPIEDDRPGPGFCERWPVVVSLDPMRYGTTKRQSDFDFGEMVDHIRSVGSYFPDLKPGDLAGERMALVVEFNKRLALALACFAFTMLGVPLGIKTHRKESSVGIAISLFLVLCFYIFVIIADSLAKRPEIHPYVFVWFPVVFSVILGGCLVQRAN